MLERAQKAWTKSKLWWLAIVLVQLASAAFATWCAWSRPEHGLPALALPVLGLLIPCATLFARAQANAAYASGEIWRRAFLLSDSLAHEPTAAEFAALLLDADTGGPNLQRAPIGNYYGSTLPPGPARLLQNLAESAFYTARLARIMAGVCTLVVIGACVLLALAVVAALGSPAIGADVTATAWLVDVGPRLASVVSVVLTFLAAGQLVEVRFAYAGLASTSSMVMSRALAKQVVTEGGVLSLLGSYEAGLASAGLPIPDLLVRMHSGSLNADWAAIAARANAP
jgi:hypothetical protein